MQEKIVATIEQLENDVFKKYGTDHKPRGKIWLSMTLDLAKLIITDVDLDAITDAVLDELTADNYHTARHAAEIVLRLNKYVLP